jgi:PAS domain S-box-containing protein
MPVTRRLVELPDASPRDGRFFDRVPGFLRQVRLTLGVRGIAWAAAAGFVALACGVMSVGDVVLSLGATDVDYGRNKAAEIHDFDQSNRALMRSIFVRSSGRRRQAEGDLPVDQAWQKAQLSLGEICNNLDDRAANVATLRAICAESAALHDRLAPEIAAFDPPRRVIDPTLLQAVVALHARVNQLSTATAREADLLVGLMADEYREALLLLAFSTGGFAAACLVLVFLLGRTSVRHYEQWQAVGEARDMLGETIEALPTAVALYDRHERLLTYNSAAVAATPALARPGILGASYEELAREIAGPGAGSGGTLPAAAKGRIERFRGKAARHMERTADGRWLEWTDKLTPSGRTVELGVDVTELKMQELEGARARADYQALVDSLSDMVFKVDTRTAILTFVSASSTALLGMAPGRMIGTSAFDHVVADDLERVVAAVRAELKTSDGRIHEVQYRARTADGAEKHVEVRFRKLPTDDGSTIIAGVMRGVEERVQLTRRLDTEMARLRSIVESSGALIVLVDRELNVVMVNSGFTALTGVGAERAVGRPMREIVDCPLDPHVIDGWLSGPLEPGRIDPVRFTNQLRDRLGRQRLIAVTATPVPGEGGFVNSIVFLGVDDTERREAERALFDAERLATVGEMAATVAHEITQPLQVINIAGASAEQELVDASAAGTAPDTEFLRSKLDRIASQVEQAGRIVGELRAFVRGTAADEAAPFDPAIAVTAAIDLTQYAVRQAGVALSVSFVDGLPQVTGHVGRLEQVLVNLIINARDAGGRTVEVVARAGERGGRLAVLITVEDSGRGIPADLLPRLFEGFMTTKPRGQGTGFGLRICRRIVEEMGGTISAANRAEGGARFEVMLPATDQRSAEA